MRKHSKEQIKRYDARHKELSVDKKKYEKIILKGDLLVNESAVALLMGIIENMRFAQMGATDALKDEADYDAGKRPIGFDSK